MRYGANSLRIGTATIVAAIGCLPVSAAAQYGVQYDTLYGPDGRYAEQTEEERQPTTLDRRYYGPGQTAPQQQQPEQRSLSYRFLVSPRVTWSDNVTLAPEGQELEDSLASVYMAGGALINRVNFSGIVNGSVQVGRYFDPPEIDDEPLYEQTVFSPNILAGGTARIVENLAFLDVSASARQQALDESTRTAGTSLANIDRQATSYAVSVSPYLRTEFSDESAVEARYRYVGVTVDDADAFNGVENYLNDSQAHELLAEYSSGRLYDRFGFAARAYANQTQEEGSDVLSEIDYTQASVSGDLRYSFSRKVALVGTVGYDDIDTEGDSPFDDDDLSGAFWKAGVSLQPGRRTQARLELGERYGGTWVDAAASWRYSSRLQFRLAATRRFLTASQAQAGRFSVLQTETLTYAEELRQLQNLTAEEILDRVLDYNSGLSDLTQQQAGLSRSDQVYADMIAQTPRWSLILRSGFDRYDYGVQTIDTYTASARSDYRLSRRLNAYGLARYQHSDTDAENGFDDCVAALQADPETAGLPDETLALLCDLQVGITENTDTVTVSAGLDYLLFRDINAYAELSRSQRFSDIEENEYTENAVTVGVSYQF